MGIVPVVVLVGSILPSPALADGHEPALRVLHRHSIETSPMSPFLQLAGKGIWGLEYVCSITRSDEVKVGVAYMNIHFEEGNTNAPAITLGYRRFLWRRLYVEYELWPTYDRFYEKNEDRVYRGFDLWNELRLGYQVDFELGGAPLLANFAWPFGFALYTHNKPDTFFERMDRSASGRYFFHFPLVFLGFRV